MNNKKDYSSEEEYWRVDSTIFVVMLISHFQNHYCDDSLYGTSYSPNKTRVVDMDKGSHQKLTVKAIHDPSMAWYSVAKVLKYTCNNVKL